MVLSFYSWHSNLILNKSLETTWSIEELNNCPFLKREIISFILHLVVSQTGFVQFLFNTIPSYVENQTH